VAGPSRARRYGEALGRNLHRSRGAAAIFPNMPHRRRLVPLFATAGGVLGAIVSSATAAASLGAAGTHALLSSRELWATIDACNPADQPYTVGIRGSMPGDGRPHDRMYMSFRLQYLDPTGKHWIDLSGASSHFVSVGTAAAARQDGRSFELVATKSSVTMRGVVNFQWRRGKAIIAATTRPTSASHVSLAGADPAGFSASECQIG
jgi:hypothetical protein